MNFSSSKIRFNQKVPQRIPKIQGGGSRLFEFFPKRRRFFCLMASLIEMSVFFYDRIISKHYLEICIRAQGPAINARTGYNRKQACCQLKVLFTCYSALAGGGFSDSLTIFGFYCFFFVFCFFLHLDWDFWNVFWIQNLLWIFSPGIFDFWTIFGGVKKTHIVC